MASSNSISHIPQPSAFISHSSADAVMAESLRSRLESQDVRCWIAPRDVTPGNPYADEIVRGIEGCVSLILLATANAISSENVLNELEQAHRLHRNILTVMVNKPTISRQLDYYIARLHWIESTGGTMDSVADRLAEVLHGQKEWPVVASPPSFSRRIRYAWPAFAGASVAILIGLLFVGFVAWYLIGRADQALSWDYRSLGWMTISTVSELAPDASVPITAELWLGNAGLPFGRTHLRTTAHLLSGNPIRSELSHLLDPGQTGHAPISFVLPPSTDHLSTFFLIPSSKPELRLCVRQEFNISVRVRAVTIQEAGEPNVTEITPSRPCG